MLISNRAIPEPLFVQNAVLVTLICLFLSKIMLLNWKSHAAHVIHQTQCNLSMAAHL